MQVGQGYLKSLVKFYILICTQAVKVTKGQRGMIPGGLCPLLIYSFHLVRQENSVTRGDEYQSWHFLWIFLIILEKTLITGGNDLWAYPRSVWVSNTTASEWAYAVHLNTRAITWFLLWRWVSPLELWTQNSEMDCSVSISSISVTQRRKLHASQRQQTVIYMGFPFLVICCGTARHHLRWVLLFPSLIIQLWPPPQALPACWPGLGREGGQCHGLGSLVDLVFLV